MDDIKKFTTEELCRELELREGVGLTVIGPYQNASVSVEGPATVFVVID